MASRIQGLQKLTLLDYPGKVAATVFFGGCNFRCPFCHNADVVLRPTRDFDERELDKLLLKRRGVLDGVCFTGGEPLMCDDAQAWMERAKELGYLVKLDTNGSYPERLRRLLDAGLVDYLAMDVKNSPDAYAETVGIERFDLAPIRESVALILQGVVPYEFRTTVVRPLHTRERILSIGEWIAGAQAYYLQAFVDSGNLIGDGLHAVEDEEMRQMCASVRKYVPNTHIRGIDQD